MFCDPLDCSSPGSSVHGLILARTLEWVAMPSSRGSSPPRVRTRIACGFCIGGWILCHHATWEARWFPKPAETYLKVLAL